MFKTKMTLLVIGFAISSNASAVETQQMLDEKFGFTPISFVGSQPAETTLASTFFPPNGPITGPLEDQLPKVFASSSDPQKAFDTVLLKQYLMELGLLIEDILTAEEILKINPEADILPSKKAIKMTVIVIEDAATHNFIDPKTAQELDEILKSWLAK